MLFIAVRFLIVISTPTIWFVNFTKMSNGGSWDIGGIFWIGLLSGVAYLALLSTRKNFTPQSFVVIGCLIASVAGIFFHIFAIL